MIASQQYNHLVNTQSVYHCNVSKTSTFILMSFPSFMCRKRQKGGNFARPEQFIDIKNDPGPILNTNKARSHWECSVTQELASSPSHSYYKLTASLPFPLSWHQDGRKKLCLISLLFLVWNPTLDWAPPIVRLALPGP